MPAALPILIAAVAGGASAALAGTAILSGALIGGGLAALSSLLAPKPPKFNTPQSRPDTRGTVVEAVEGARWVIGRARTGGSLKFYEETNDGQDVWMGIALSEGACGSIERIFINEQEVDFTRTGNELAIGMSADGDTDFTGKAFLYEYFDGDGTQGSEIRAACTEFTADHTFMGLSWMAVHLFQPRYNMPDGRFWSQRPQIQVVMQGMLMTWPGEATPTWTENAAAVRYWVERERAGLPAGAIDETAFTAAHSLCDESVSTTLPNNIADYTATGLRYRANGVITDDMALDDIRSEIDWCWQGWAVESGGIMYFRPGVDRTATAAFGVDDIISVDAVRPAPSLQDRVNALSMQLQSSLDHDYLPYDVPEVEDTPALTRDDNYYLPQHTGQRLFVNGPVDAARLIAIGLRRNRASMTLRVTLKPGLMLERFSIIPSDIVTMTLPEYGFDAFLFMVISISVNEDFSVSLLLDEERRGAYADTLDLPPIMARDIGIPGPRQVPTVGGLTGDEIAVVQQDGTLSIFLVVTWDLAAVDHTEVDVREQGGTTIDSGSTFTTRYLLPGVTVGETYEFRARHVGRGGHAGERTSWLNRTIGGDLTPPEDAAGLSGSDLPGGYLAEWTASTAPDYSHTEVWQNLSNAQFSQASLVGVVSGNSYQRFGFGAVTQVRLWVRHVDRSNNRGGTDMATFDTGEAAMTTIDPDDIVELVNEAIEANPAFADLAGEIMRAETAANEAAASALTAGTQATSASGSATAAAGSATAASDSATASEDEATAAAGSATAAVASATLAGTRAAAAATSAGSASASATMASQRASAAQASATEADTSGSNASTSATQAAASRTEAGSSAAAAQVSQQAAAGSADDADAAVAGIDATVAAAVDDELGTTFAAAVVLRAKAGSATGELELVALSDLDGSVSTLRISADQFLVDAANFSIDADGRLQVGSIVTDQITLGAVTTTRLFARAVTDGYAAVSNTNRTLGTGWTDIISLGSIPGESGAQLVIVGNVLGRASSQFDPVASWNVRLVRGVSTITSSAGAGAQGVAATANHIAAATVKLQAQLQTGGDTGSVSTAWLAAFVQKR